MPTLGGEACIVLVGRGGVDAVVSRGLVRPPAWVGFLRSVGEGPVSPPYGSRVGEGLSNMQYLFTSKHNKITTELRNKRAEGCRYLGGQNG